MAFETGSLTIAGALGVYAVMSAVSFILYWVDKKRARVGAWRISEGALHGSELFGGWPGAWLAQRVLRHKRQKTEYMAVFWVIVAVHAAGWTWWSGVFRS